MYRNNAFNILYCSKLQNLPSVPEQFPPIGTTQTVSQSQEVQTDDPKTTEEGDNDNDGLYMLLFGPDKNGKYKPCYFDEEGYKILDLTSKKLQVKKKGEKSAHVEKEDVAESGVGVPGEGHEGELMIPFTLDVNKPPPPPSAPISTAYDWWVKKGTAMFPHIQISAPQPTVPTTAPSASASIQGAAAPASSDKSKSVPNVVQSDVRPRTHRYSQNRPQPKDKSKIPLAK